MAKDKGNTRIGDEKVSVTSADVGSIVPADVDAIEKASASEDMTLAEVLDSIATTGGQALDPSEWEVGGVGAGAEFYWPAERGMILRGRVLGVEERMTSLLVDGEASSARFYTVELTAPAFGIRAATGEVVEVPAGQSISVLERTVLRRLEQDVGREVIVVCDGKAKTKRGLSLWRYRSWRKRQPAPALPPQQGQQTSF